MAYSVEVVLTSTSKGVADREVIQKVDNIEVTNCGGLVIKRSHPNGTNYVVFQAQPGAWALYKRLQANE